MNAVVNPFAIEVEVVPIEPKAPEKLVDKVKNAASTRKPRAKGKKMPRGKSVDIELFSKLLPTIVAAFVASMSRDLIADPYKQCAPSETELKLIIAPLFSILSRQIEITGQASENVLDLINAAIAGIIFSTRSYVAYARIKKEEKQAASGRDSNTDNRAVRGDSAVGSHASDSATTSNASDTADDERAIKLFTDLHNRDIEGRIRLGMLPPRVPDENVATNGTRT